MAFIRKIKKKSGTYYANVETYREDGKVKQRVLSYMGKDVEGQIVKKVQSDKIEIAEVRQYLDGYVLYELTKQLKLEESLGTDAPYFLLMVYSHILERVSISQMPDWLKLTDLPTILGVNGFSSKKFYNSLDKLQRLDFTIVEKELIKVWETQENIKETLIIDVTDTYFNGKHAEWKSRRGKDGKNDKLVQIALAVSAKNGFPVFHKLYEGNINNVKILQDMLSELKLGKYEGIIVDRGMYSKENVEELNKLQIHGVVGMRTHKNVEDEILSKIQRDEIFQKECQVKLISTKVYIKGFPYLGGRVIVIYNPTLEILKKEHDMDSKKKAKSTNYMGYSLLYHNTDLEDAAVVKKYFDRDIVEKSFRQMKGMLELRPIRVWLMSHIEAHIKLCYLSYCILSWFSYLLKPIDITASKALRELNKGYKVRLEDKSSNFSWNKTVTLTALQKKILDKVNVVYKT